MKDATLHSIITARLLFEDARDLCTADDRYTATAGLIVLQDALELILLALLVEKGIDEFKSLEFHTFDQLIGDLSAEGIKVPKSGTLKALNKHRVLAKHYGQLAEPVTVRVYLDAVIIAVDAVLLQIVGKSFHEIFLTDILKKGETLQCLEEASKFIEKCEYLDALIEIRKAIFIEIENDYSVYAHREYEEGSSGMGLMGMLLGGWKAPFYTRNKKWIAKNVRDPMDYIQIDYDQLRLDAMEWGVNTAELQNLRRLTPMVFRQDKNSTWHVKYDTDFPANEATLQNAQYCLDRTIAVVLKKQAHEQCNRFPHKDKFSPPPPIYLGDPIYKRASTDSNIVHTVNNGYEYTIREIVTGFDGKTIFQRVLAATIEKDEQKHPKAWESGYLVKRDEKVES